MKKIYCIYIVLFVFGLFVLESCQDLDLNPLSEGSSENWYSTEAEIEMSLNGLFRIVFWPAEKNYDWTDDHQGRATLTPITNGTINGEWSTSNTIWKNAYKAIARANVLLSNMDKAEEIGISQTKINQYIAEALFVRAAQHAILCSYYGDVVYVDREITIEEAYKMSKTPKAEIMARVYQDIDSAVVYLPITVSGGVQRVTKGAAYAFKARYALYNEDWEIAVEEAQNCIDLGIYELHPDFSNLFLASTKKSKESIFVLPRSIEYESILYGAGAIMGFVPRNRGGYASEYPSWELFCSFLCTDGLPIDKSPLFDRKNPFKNRDPRCAATIVEFGTTHLGVVYDPNPKATMVYDYQKGQNITNMDCKSGSQYASYNGLILKKGVDTTWVSHSFKVDPDYIIIRYADVLLMYAESKIELNEIDETVLNAINSVRARAYGVNVTATSQYPAVTTTDQNELRKIVRIERRMELAYEGLRYMDIIRWRLAEKALNRPSYGLLDKDLLNQLVTLGFWFFPEIPEIDEDGIADFSSMYNKKFIKLIVQRSFNADRQYLWPIPSKEVLINDSLKQNPNY